MRILGLSLLLSIAVASLPAFGADLGTVGPTYEIAEADLIEVIKDRFLRLEKAGELDRLQEDYKQRVVDSVENPKPVQGIAATQTARTYYLDPTWTLDRNVVDEKGNVLFPAGTRINPFDFDHLNKTLLFFDASDKKQVAFAKRFMAGSKLPVKPILIAGAPLKLMREWKREVFYDQGGALSKRLSIANSPAVVTQEGKRLRVDEVRL